jgi:hypothetical protein
MDRALDPGVRVKAEFIPDDTTKGAFRLEACDTAIYTSIPELDDPSSGLSMYGFNLYVERGTLSPEPQIVVSLQPGQESTWTQRLVFDDIPRDEGEGSVATASATAFDTMASIRSMQSHWNERMVALYFIILAFGAAWAMTMGWKSSIHRRQLYQPIGAESP